MSSYYRIVGHTGANRRRDRRYEIAPIEIAMDGARYVTANWSLGGALLSDYTGLRRVGDRLMAGLTPVESTGGPAHTVEVEVVRVGPAAGELALAFGRLDALALDTLEGLITGRLRRGRGAGTA